MAELQAQVQMLLGHLKAGVEREKMAHAERQHDQDIAAGAQTQQREIESRPEPGKD
jgi:hypothetical protein